MNDAPVISPDGQTALVIGGLCTIALGFLIDAINFKMSITALWRKTPSNVLLVPWIFYFLGACLVSGAGHKEWMCPIMGYGLLVHAFCGFAIRALAR